MFKKLNKKGQAVEAVIVAGALIVAGHLGYISGKMSKNGEWAIHDIDKMRSFTNYNPSSRILFQGSSYKADWDAINLRYPKPTEAELDI